MSFSKTFVLACATSTLFSLAVGLAMFSPETVNVAQGSQYAPKDNHITGRDQRILISGHSLTDRPFPEYLSEVAADAGIPISWRMQHASGSSIKQRFSGKFPRVGPEPYDILIITEQHRLLDSLLWQDTIQSLRAFQDNFIAANEKASTYFFTPWIHMSDLADPSDWIDYERRAAPVWGCVVQHVNEQIAADGRRDKIGLIPTSLALSALVERLMSDPDFEGFEDLGRLDRMNAIFSDTVHLTPLGSYYVAEISFSSVYGIETGMPSRPGFLNVRQANALKAFATGFMRNYRAQNTAAAKGCEKPVSLGFASHYAAYTERTYHRDDKGYVMARLHRLRNTVRFIWQFRNGLG